jgi:uridine phosphorylase
MHFLIHSVHGGVHRCTRLQFKGHLETELKAATGGKHAVVAGINASADSFYSSQGRISENFHDFNSKVISNLEARPELATLKCLEMETHHLLDLARCSTKKAKIYAAGAAMVIANRHTLEGIDKQTLCELEEIGGRAGLEALIAFPLPTI